MTFDEYCAEHGVNPNAKILTAKAREEHKARIEGLRESYDREHATQQEAEDEKNNRDRWLKKLWESAPKKWTRGLQHENELNNQMEIRFDGNDAIYEVLRVTFCGATVKTVGKPAIQICSWPGGITFRRRKAGPRLTD